MLLDYETLKLIWWVFVGLFLIVFALTDGFDLGIAMALPLIGQNDSERRIILNVIGPTWEGNQVWFISAGGALFAVWPIVYSTAFSAFYWVLLLTLWALFLRPVGFDYRSKLNKPAWRSFWDWGLLVGALVPTLVFGAAFGNLLYGVPFHLDNDMRSYFEGSLWGLLNPFALFCGLVSVVMLLIHGAAYLQLRTKAQILERARRLILIGVPLYCVLFALGGVWVAMGINGYQITQIGDTNSVLTPLGKTVTITKGAWLHNYTQFHWMLIAPFAGFIGAFVTLFAAWRRFYWLSFLGSSTLVFGTIATAGVSLFPFLMPSSLNFGHSLTVWDSVSSYHSLLILLGFNVIVLPCIVIYTLWVYKKLWGEVTQEVIDEDGNSAY